MKPAVYTAAELLTATGNVWKVFLYRDGNRRRLHRVTYVRARTSESAVDIGFRLFGGRYGIARPWDPFEWGEHMTPYVREVAHG